MNDENKRDYFESEPDEVKEDLKKQLDTLKLKQHLLKTKSDEFFNSFMKVKAELENVRKRSDKEIDNIIKYSNKRLLLELLPLLDSLESCLSNQNTIYDREGIHIFYKMLNKIFEKHNVKKIVANVNTDFDPLIHEVISAVEHDNYDNKINSVLQAGYMLNDQILRYSKVTIFKRK